MEKTAQRKSGKRSILNKLREMSNVGGIAAEKFFNPEFERVMNNLRESDNKIRAVVSGQEIEGEDPGDDPVSLKDLYKSAKSSLNRREYMTGIAFLGRFHKKMNDIVNLIDKLNFEVDQVHHEFLFKDLDDEQKKHLSSLKTRFATTKYELVVEASIMDFLVNVGTERGRALSAWEKRYPKQVGRLKKESNNLLQKTESALNTVISALKEMATARATRKIDDYMKAAGKIKNHYLNYDKVFKDFYTTNVKGFLEKQELVAPTKTIDDNVSELSKQEVPLSVQNTPLSNSSIRSIQPQNSIPVEVSSPTRNLAPLPSPTRNLAPLPSINAPSNVPDLEISDLESIPSTQRSPDTTYKPISEEIITDTDPQPKLSLVPAENEETPNPTIPSPPPEKVVAAHAEFYSTLEKMSNESPLVLSSFIRKYALSIRHFDLETAIKLLNVVKSIKE